MQYTNINMLQQYSTKTSSFTQVKASFVLSGKVSGMLLRIEHVFNLPNHLDEPRFIVDDLNFLILVKMLWTVDRGENKTINLLSKNSTFSLECFLEDYKNCHKKFYECTKAAEKLHSAIAQVAVTFSGFQRTRNSTMRKHQ